jgi:hypothetical protein
MLCQFHLRSSVSRRVSDVMSAEDLRSSSAEHLRCYVSSISDVMSVPSPIFCQQRSPMLCQQKISDLLWQNIGCYVARHRRSSVSRRSSMLCSRRSSMLCQQKIFDVMSAEHLRCSASLRLRLRLGLSMSFQ